MFSHLYLVLGKKIFLGSRRFRFCSVEKQITVIGYIGKITLDVVSLSVEVKSVQEVLLSRPCDSLEPADRFLRVQNNQRLTLLSTRQVKLTYYL